jgi:ubiquinone/menaquinone biosynthesis C-methylase UbiE
MPSAGSYDLMAGRLLGRFYSDVARRLAAEPGIGTVLDAGCGPGRLALRLAQEMPATRVTGVDVSPEMIALARERARTLGLDGRATFEVGDVSELPFGDGQFDMVVSTLSVHHWPDPVAGLTEIHRVLKPGARAFIYDVPGWLARLEAARGGLASLVVATPFRRGRVRAAWKIGPVPLLELLTTTRNDLQPG